ncbi:hypothetical protein MTsPCn9_11010 [Croceitalea sp. MTPC9]|nr:hypothetical protein MTsPCn6_26230 [Croceitalea sp. MTPC6]GMN16165.1 hypothetical protein MTsPCn9_11010 [Croceitalea sp. MTPC9]
MLYNEAVYMNAIYPLLMFSHDSGMKEINKFLKVTGF